MPYLVAIFQIGRGNRDQVANTDQAVFYRYALATARQRLNTAQHQQRGRPCPREKRYGEPLRTADAGDLGSQASLLHLSRPVCVPETKGHAGVHFGAQILIGMQDLHLHLNGGLLAIGFGRDLIDDAVRICDVGKGVGGDDAFLRGVQFGKIVLVNIEFDFEDR